MIARTIGLDSEQLALPDYEILTYLEYLLQSNYNIPSSNALFKDGALDSTDNST